MMGSAVVGYGIAVYGRLSFTNGNLFFYVTWLVLIVDLRSLIYLLRVATRFWGHCGQYSTREIIDENW